MNESKRINLICNCLTECGMVRFSHWPESDCGDPEELYLGYWKQVFSFRQDGIFRTIWRRIEWATKILIGKEFLLYEICLSREQIDQMRDWLEEV